MCKVNFFPALFSVCVWFGVQRNSWGMTLETCRSLLNSPCSTRSCSTAASPSALLVCRQRWTQQGIMWVCISALQNQPQNHSHSVPNPKGCICAKDQTQTGHPHPSTTFFGMGWEKPETFCRLLYTLDSSVCVSTLCFTVWVPEWASWVCPGQRMWFVCPACWPSTGLVWCTWLCCSGNETRFHVRVNTGRLFLVT